MAKEECKRCKYGAGNSLCPINKKCPADCKMFSLGGCVCKIYENREHEYCPYFKKEETLVYRVNMNDVPADIRRKISAKLDEKGLEAVHMGYGSMLEGDNNLFIVIAREHEPKLHNCYCVFGFEDDPDDTFGGTLYRECAKLSYADALIEMGERIKE